MDEARTLYFEEDRLLEPSGIKPPLPGIGRSEAPRNSTCTLLMIALMLRGIEVARIQFRTTEKKKVKIGSAANAKKLNRRSILAGWNPGASVIRADLVT